MIQKKNSKFSLLINTIKKNIKNLNAFPKIFANFLIPDLTKLSSFKPTHRSLKAIS